jgi:O-antigen ligase
MAQRRASWASARPRWAALTPGGQGELTGARGLDRLLVPLLSVLLVVRILTDDLSPNSRHSGSLNLSAVIALAFVLLATGMTLHRRNGLLPGALAVLWLCIWTAVAVHTNGLSGETLREGVREISVVALFLIVYNARGAITPSGATRIIQFAGFIPALISLYQLATFTGMNRPYGTFSHPDSAAMFFAIATAASLWLYLDDRQRRIDALLTVLFAFALIATFSIDGLATLAAMLIALGALRSGSLRIKLTPCAVAAAVIVVFFAIPLGSQRVAAESSTGQTASGEPNSSLTWRLNKWKMLIPEWESSPVIGRGLGTTTTTEATLTNRYAGKPPHNEYIRYLVETGVIGLVILLAAVAMLVRCLFQMRKAPDPEGLGTFGVSTIAIVVVVGCLVNSLADNTLLNSPTCYAAALILAAAFSMQLALASRR